MQNKLTKQPNQSQVILTKRHLATVGHLILVEFYSSKSPLLPLKTFSFDQEIMFKVTDK